MLKNVQFGREVFTLSPVTYITVDFKKLVSELFQAGCVGRQGIYQEKYEAIIIAPKHNNRFETRVETFPYLIQKHPLLRAMHHSDFTL